MENPYQTFNQEFFKKGLGYTIQWYDKEGIIELDDNRLVSIKLDDVGTRDHYVGYWVEIINKYNGSIYKKFFRFQLCMEFNHRDSYRYFYVRKEDNKLKWYISTPFLSGPETMSKIISSFIKKFI